MYHYLYGRVMCVPSVKKQPIIYNIVHNFAICWLIFKILSLTDTLVNVQQNCH